MNNIMLAIRNTNSGSEHNLSIKFKEELNPFGRWFKSS